MKRLQASFHRVADALSREDTSLIRELRSRNFLATALSVAANTTTVTLQAASLSTIATFISHPSCENVLAELGRVAAGEARFRGIFTSKHADFSSGKVVGGSMLALLRSLAVSDDGLRILTGESGVDAIQVTLRYSTNRTVSLKLPARMTHDAVI